MYMCMPVTRDAIVDVGVDVFIWKPNRLGVPSYRESHVSGKGVPKSKEINIGMPQRRRQRVPHKWASKERRDCTRAVTELLLFRTNLTSSLASPMHAGAIARGIRSCQMRTPSIFFFGPRKGAVRPHPPNPPWLRACRYQRLLLNNGELSQFGRRF